MKTQKYIEIKLVGVPLAETNSPLMGTQIAVWGRLVEKYTGDILSDWMEIPAKNVKLECDAVGFATAQFTTRVHNLEDVSAILTKVDLDPGDMTKR